MNDQILYWNAVAIEANRSNHTDNADPGVNGPTLSSRALALVHLAMYDAAVGTSTTGYFNSGGVPNFYHPDASAVAVVANTLQGSAIAAAAHSMLSKLYPSRKMLWDEMQVKTGIPPTTAGYSDGVSYGLRVAHLIWESRKNDPGGSDDGYVASQARGKHRPDPNNPKPNDAPFYGQNSANFAVTQRWGIKPPYAVDSPKYIEALEQVIGKGIEPGLMGTLDPKFSKRTAEETMVGIFWGYDGSMKLGTPPRFFNQIVREIVEKTKLPGNADFNSQEENAHLFAMVNVAMGDAGILAWEQKYKYDFWRPILGVREQDGSMGQHNSVGASFDKNCDPRWLPLGAPRTNELRNDFTPPFPAYPSGHATFGAAALQVVRRFYGFNGDFAEDDLLADTYVVSDEFNGVNADNAGTTRPRHARQFKRGLWQMILENGLSRVFLGVHWYFDAFEVKANAFKKRSDAKRDLGFDEINIVIDTTNPSEVGIGGVPLGITIANDIFENKFKVG